MGFSQEVQCWWLIKRLALKMLSLVAAMLAGAGLIRSLIMAYLIGTVEIDPWCNRFSYLHFNTTASIFR